MMKHAITPPIWKIFDSQPYCPAVDSWVISVLGPTKFHSLVVCSCLHKVPRQKIYFSSRPARLWTFWFGLRCSYRCEICRFSSGSVEVHITTARCQQSVLP